MAFDEVKRLMVQASKIPTIERIYPNYLGETTLHPRFDDILKLTQQLNISHKIGITTNGTTLNRFYKLLIDSAVNYVFVSIDGPKKYNEKWRVGTDHDEVLSGLAKLRSYRDLKKASTRIFVMCVRYDQNRGELSQLIDDIKAKADWCCITPYIDSCFRMRYKGMTLKGGRGDCWDMWSKMYILSDGSVTTCCYDYNSKNIIPDMTVQEKHIEDVFYSKQFDAVREDYRSGKFQIIPSCRSCNIYETKSRSKYNIALGLRAGRISVTQGINEYVIL